jgi:hypothetical protein
MFLMAPKIEELGRATLGAVELLVDDAIDDEQKKSNDENRKPATRHERDRDRRDTVTLMTSFPGTGRLLVVKLFPSTYAPLSAEAQVSIHRPSKREGRMALH